ncbi:conserved hypothetical protein [Trichinella spiralis]|uniref:hypothetical protein n=1 Tax=Trichinella spiralis TaxID=6334 RepID=UPI0001EFD579|nr:conserved hypothetical protein [Trichinella spiralis]
MSVTFAIFTFEVKKRSRQSYICAYLNLGSERGLIVSLAIGCAELLYRGSSPWYEKKKSLSKAHCLPMIWSPSSQDLFLQSYHL